LEAEVIMKLDGKTRTATLAAGALGLLVLGGATVAAFRSSAPAPVAVASPAAVPVETVAVAQTTPAATTVPVVTVAQPQTVRVVQRQPRRYVKKRSGKKSALIIGGSTLGGALIGNVVGGKKATIVGGLAGAAAGTVYDRKTRKKTYYR
jgi:uncharacterized protein YcfJ